MAGADEHSAGLFARPTGQASTVVRRYEAHSFSGLEPGHHRGLPSRSLTFRFSLGEPTHIVAMPDPNQAPDEFFGFVGGLHSRPAMVSHPGSGVGCGIDVSPLAARQLFGVPAGHLASAVVGLPDLWGPDLSGEFHERLEATTSWPARFGVIDEVVARVLPSRRDTQLPAEVLEAWRCIVDSRGKTPVEELAKRVDWSRRHLASRFKVEIGLSPKALSRIVRFEHACELLLRPGRGSLADIAAVTGFYDQSHLTREWSDLAGCTPTDWLAEELHDPPRLELEVPFVQDARRFAG